MENIKNSLDNIALTLNDIINKFSKYPFKESFKQEIIKEINAIFGDDFNEYQLQALIFQIKYKVGFKTVWLRYEKHFEDDKKPRHIFKVTLSRNGKRFSFNFGQSIADDAKHPDLYSVLACLTKYDVGTFENFCSDFGYELYNENYTGKNKSSIKIYKAVCKEFQNVEKLFGDCLDELQEIQ